MCIPIRTKHVTVFQTYTAGFVGLPASEWNIVCVCVCIHYIHAVDNVIDFISPGDTRTFVVRDESIIHRIWRVISTRTGYAKCDDRPFRLFWLLGFSCSRHSSDSSSNTNHHIFFLYFFTTIFFFNHKLQLCVPSS